MSRRSALLPVAASGVAILGALIGVWFFVFGGPWPFGEAVVRSVEAHDGSLTLIVSSCGGQPSVARLEETPDEVRIAVEATEYFGFGGDCQDTLEIDLAEPLGRRALIDLVSGRRVEDVSRVGSP